MPTPETFEILVKGDPVTGSIHRPESQPPDAALPSVLVCSGFPIEPPESTAFLVGLTSAFLDAGLAVVEFRPRLSSLNGDSEFEATATTDDASAVFRWMALQPSIDTKRIGVLGYSTGAVVAAGLSARTGMVAGLCLLGPAVPDDIVATNGSGREDESSPGLETVPAGLAEALHSLSPVQEATAHDRPTLVIHGAADRTVRVERSFEYQRALQQAAHQVEHLLIARADHGFQDDEARGVCIEKLLGFFTTLTPVASGNGKA